MTTAAGLSSSRTSRWFSRRSLPVAATHRVLRRFRRSSARFPIRRRSRWRSRAALPPLHSQWTSCPLPAGCRCAHRHPHSLCSARSLRLKNSMRCRTYSSVGSASSSTHHSRGTATPTATSPCICLWIDSFFLFTHMSIKYSMFRICDEYTNILVPILNE